MLDRFIVMAVENSAKRTDIWTARASERQHVHDHMTTRPHDRRHHHHNNNTTTTTTTVFQVLLGSDA